MSEHDDDQDQDDLQERFTSVDRQTIRDVILEQVEARRLEAQEREHAERQRAREGRTQRRRSDNLKKVRARKANSLRLVNEANERVRGHISAAARALQAALRDAKAVPLPRHSEEGRTQAHTVRSLGDAVMALRRVGAGAFNDTDFEVDLDLDVG